MLNLFVALLRILHLINDVVSIFTQIWFLKEEARVNRCNGEFIKTLLKVFGCTSKEETASSNVLIASDKLGIVSM